MIEEFWRWTEYRRTVSNRNPKAAKIITAGIDIGSVGSKAVIMLDGEVYAWSVMRTGASSPDSAVRVLNSTLEGTGITEKDIHYIVGTGYGRVNVPMARKTVTEIACHARGASFIWGSSVRTILDVGGQDIKAIRVDEKGKVISFLMNDKCAAGTGRGMEVLADLLAVPIEQIGDISLSVKEEPPPVSSTCVVFAKSEAVGLLRNGWTKDRVLASYCLAMAHRMYELLERVGIEKELAITGGQSKNKGIVSRVEKLVGFNVMTNQNWKEDGLDPITAGAIGAALFAKDLYERKR